MRNDNKTVSATKNSKSSDKKSEFNFDRYLAEMEASKVAEKKYRTLIPKGAIEAPFDQKPGPDMLFDYNIGVWIPKNWLKERQRLIEEETQRIVNTMPDPTNHGFTFGGEKIKTEESENKKKVQQEQQNTGTPVAPTDSTSKEEKTVAKPKSAKTTSKLKKSDSPPPIKASIEQKVMAVEEKPETDTDIPTEVVEQSKKTRRSAKMIESDFDTLAAKYICYADLAEKKPLFFPERIRESLRKIAGLVPGSKVSPSHIAIHVIEAWIDEHRELFNRMFANQKTSI